MDEIDLTILELLQKDSRTSNRVIGEMTHMTGQAVGVRITRMIEQGIIKNYSIEVNKVLLGIAITAIVRVYMTSHNHENFLKFVNQQWDIVEVHKTSSDSCYSLKIETTSIQSLDETLEKLNKFGNYQVSLSTKRIK